MWALLLLSTIWSDPLGSSRGGAKMGPPARLSQIREAFDELDQAQKHWQRERKEQLEEQMLDQQRANQKVKDESPMPDKALKKYKVIEVGKGSGRVRGRSKVIELPQKQGLDAELDQLEADAEAHREQCQKDPERCAREKKQREVLRKGNDAWADAEAQNYEKRRAAIEAEARRFQEQLNAARKREEQRQAERMGGKLDAEGNFVDSDLAEVPVRPEPPKPEQKK